MAYLMVCILFRQAYAGYGMAADSVRKKEMGIGTKLLIKTVVRFYNRFFRQMSPQKKAPTSC